MGELVAGELVVDELNAVFDWFEGNDIEGVVDEDAVVGALADVEREMDFLFPGATPSQTNARELKAISARHSPSKLPAT